MAYFLFLDESGHDHRTSPYEVLAGIAVEDRDVWNLIEALNAAEERHFGIRYSRVKEEIKGKKFLKKKVFKLAQQLPPIALPERSQLARSCIENGAMAGKKELTALAQSKLAFVEEVFEICGRFRCVAFASIVEPNSPVSEADVLRKDYSYLFERFYYFLEDRGLSQQGIVVFDELEKSQSRILIAQMESYFLGTAFGRLRSRQIIPEPFFVHSDLTSLIQVADLSAYTISWGFRLDRMNREARDELVPFSNQLANLRYRAARDIMGIPNFVVWSFSYLDDLRCRDERDCK